MPPPRVAQNKQSAAAAASNKGVVTRSKRAGPSGGENVIQVAGKRKAESPLKKPVKRSAFGDITNAIGKSANDTKKSLKNVATAPGKSFGFFKDKKVVEKPVPSKSQVQHVATSRKAAVVVPPAPAPSVQPVLKSKPKEEVKVVVKESVTRSSSRLSARLSLDNESGENSLYVSALEDISDDNIRTEAKVEESVANKLPEGVEDFDAENAEDPCQVSDYVMDIFQYLKDREAKFAVADYMDKQVCLSRWMRSLLVDWMVEVQENFELNHETLYLAVKIVDIYLSKVLTGKETLQLVGAAAMFISSKFDERVPPLVDDLIYICDGAYTHQELIKMEMDILRVIDFDLSMPLSYRFLRRYARCAKIAMPQLTLARYILELSLMDYGMVTLSDSKLAAASLLLALRMQNLGGWTPTLEYYSGYKVEDFKDICLQLNEMLHKKPKTALSTVRNKYSHKVFFEVAKLPLLQDLNL